MIGVDSMSFVKLGLKKGGYTVQGEARGCLSEGVKAGTHCRHNIAAIRRMPQVAATLSTVCTCLKVIFCNHCLNDITNTVVRQLYTNIEALYKPTFSNT